MHQAFGRDKFAAQFCSRKFLLLDQQNLQAVLSETDRGARARRAGADDSNVIYGSKLDAHTRVQRPDNIKRLTRECSTFTSSSPAASARRNNSSGLKLRRIDNAPSSTVKRWSKNLPTALYR